MKIIVVFLYHNYFLLFSMKKISYIPIKNRSTYSILESSVQISSLIKLAKDMGFPAIGLADTNNLFSAMDFSLESIKNNIQPILGAQVNLILDPSDFDSPSKITLYAKNEIGYKNLMQIVTKSYMNTEDIYGKILLNQISPDGLLCLFDFSNDLSLDFQKMMFKELNKIFGQKGDFFAEICRKKIKTSADIKKENELIDFSYQNSIPLVASNDGYFLKEEDFDSYKVLRCIDRGEYISNYTPDYVTENNYLKSQEEMQKLFDNMPIALENTIVFAKKCHFLLKKKKVVFPKYDCQNSQNSEEDELEFQAIVGIIKRFVSPDSFSMLFGAYGKYSLDNPDDLKNALNENVPDNYIKQLFYEMKIILETGFAGYFLIVADFIKWAKNNSIPVGPGRGSGAGSVIAWSVEITEIDPIKFGLIFERFLNPDRVSLPDFDIDFCQQRRGEVIDYVKQKYGNDHIANIITFGKLQAKAVLKDVGRVMQIPYSKVDSIASLIPFSAIQAVTLSEAIEKEKALQDMAKEDEQVSKLFTISLELEGANRNLSTHAAGVIISRDPLEDVIPLYKEKDSNDLITQFDMYNIENAGLIKFDFLGLKTLSVIQKAVDLIKQRHQIDLNINTIPLNDSNSFEMLRKRLTLGIFQLEGSGISDVLEQLNIDKFEQIIALTSLYRPGPLENIPQYIDCKNGRAEPDYMYECLEPVLKETYGIPVYQEQVMQIARVLAGYTLAQADLLRKAMGKKLPEEMKKHEEIFVEEAYKRYGGTKDKALKLFNQIKKFSGYAFNKAHATSYSMISYQTAYLKSNYTVEFLTALMDLDIHNTDKLAMIVQEARKFNIDILLPDINKSMVSFNIENESIRYSFSAIKGIGESVSEAIVNERKNGEYTSVKDMICRLPKGALNKRQIENLIAAGAFDKLHSTRKDVYDDAKNLNNLTSEIKRMELSLFDDMPPSAANTQSQDWSTQEKIEKEYEVFGFYINEHPVEAYFNYSQLIGATNTSKVFDDLRNNKEIKIIATINQISKKMNKNREKYAFAQISDNYGIVPITFFSKQLQMYENIISEGETYLMYLTGKEQNDNIRITCNYIEKILNKVLKSIDGVVFDAKSTDDLKNIKEFLNLFEKNNTDHVFSNVSKVKIFLNVFDKNKIIRLVLKNDFPLSEEFYRKSNALNPTYKYKEF
jgi:DNA polymerase III subunit alpha